MAFARPTLVELATRVQADIVSRASLAGALLRRSFLYVLARVWAGTAHLQYGFLDWLSRQLFPDTSDVAFLRRQAALFGVTQVPPSYATATGTFTGTGTVPANRVLAIGGVEYVLDADVTVPGSGTFTAREAGAASTLTVGAVLSLEQAVAGVDSSVVVTGVGDGADAESPDAFRQRFLERLREPPHGGTAPDYVAWAKSVPGVTRVWVRPGQLGPGTVVVYFVRDNDGAIIPDSGEVATVQAVLQTEAPVHVSPTAFAPVVAPLDPELTISPDTVANRAAVLAALTDLLLRAEPGQTVLLSRLQAAVGNVDGIEDFTFVAPVANVPHATNQLPTLGVVTWS